MQNEKTSNQRKVGYSTDAAILSSLLHYQPLSKGDLDKKILGARPGTNSGTIYYNLRFLTETGDIKEKDGIYSLFNYSDVQNKIREACEQRKNETARGVRISDISNMVGESPDSVKKYIYQIAKSLDLYVDSYNP
jgi:hypothetical protein